MVHPRFMRVLIFLAMLSPLSLWSYELLNWSNSKPRSPLEILFETQMSQEQLQLYSCDNPERVNLFFNTTIQNMKKDSLKIIDQKKRVYTYQNGSIWNSKNKKISFKRKPFVKIVVKALRKLEKVEEGKRLIEELQFSPNPFYIQKGMAMFIPSHLGERKFLGLNNASFISNLDDLKPYVEGLPFKNIGYGGIISLNLQMKSKFIESDDQKRSISPMLVLAHEMYHAYDGMRGLLDRRFVSSDTLEPQVVCEFRAVRFENAIRKAIGQKYRKFYTNTPTDSRSMLDENGEPIVFPSPCIKWLHEINPNPVADLQASVP